MTNGCSDNQETVSRLVDNELEPTERRRTAAHVLTCDHCSGAAGKILATKRLLDRSEVEAAVPPGFGDRWRERLALPQNAAGASRGPRLASTAMRSLAIAAVGLILIGGALMVSSRATPHASAVDLLVGAHRSVAPGPLYPNAGAYCTVGAGGSSTDQWRLLRRALLKIDGALVTHTVYQIGSCAISVFEGPASWQPATGADEPEGDTEDMRVLSGTGISLAVWVQSGRRHVVVAQAPPRDVVELARQRQMEISRSLGL